MTGSGSDSVNQACRFRSRLLVGCDRPQRANVEDAELCVRSGLVAAVAV